MALIRMERMHRHCGSLLLCWRYISLHSHRGTPSANYARRVLQPVPQIVIQLWQKFYIVKKSLHKFPACLQWKLYNLWYHNATGIFFSTITASLRVVPVFYSAFWISLSEWTAIACISLNIYLQSCHFYIIDLLYCKDERKRDIYGSTTPSPFSVIWLGAKMVWKTIHCRNYDTITW